MSLNDDFMRLKNASKIVSIIIASVMCLSIFVGCGGDGNTPTGEKISNENTPLVIATQQPEGVFNQFFASSGNDTTIIGMTQLPMLTSDAKGVNSLAGDDQPTVCKDFSMKTTDTRPDKTNEKDFDNYYTTYEFLIKDNVKFSDGKPLTIKDVLFNMYVYLDPVYTGSSTMYSTPIKGLQYYRTQTMSEAEQANFEKRFSGLAEDRVENIIAWADDKHSTLVPEDEQVKKDLAVVDEKFKEELMSDWANASAQVSTYDEKYEGRFDFTDTWQVFAMMYNKIRIVDEGKPSEKWENDWANRVTESNKNDANNWTSLIFADMLGNKDLEAKKENYKTVVSYYATAQTVRTEFAADEKAKYYANIDDNEKRLFVEGITTRRTSEFNGKQLGKDMDVLKVVINGVDPKAIWNFHFGVAPMHYYSTPEVIAKYDGQNNFGISYANREFYKKMQQIQVPVGAGPYKASDKNSTEKLPEKAAFYDSNVAYFVRNENFCLGSPKIKKVRYQVISPTQLFDAVAASKKTVTYSNPNATLANVNKLQAMQEKGDKIGYELVDTLGYGYIGINSGKIPDINLRRALMAAMNTELCLEYYSSQMARIIHRPMSDLSWAYPTGATAYYPYDGDGIKAGDYSGITQYLDNVNGIKKVGNKYSSYVNQLTGKTERLKITFTLAGETIDHPAYKTLKQAEDILEVLGFEIDIVNDPNALLKLANGSLSVWAAAWSSTIDPDMYQVYHMKSTATSVLNWGYPAILNNQDKMSEEYGILEQLSKIIEKARETNEKEIRKANYAEALDLVMDLAVELPTYQRKDLFVFDTSVLDKDSLPKTITSYNGPLSEIWNLSLKETK